MTEDLMPLLELEETDQPGKANSVYWYGHGLRDGERHKCLKSGSIPTE